MYNASLMLTIRRKKSKKEYSGLITRAGNAICPKIQNFACGFYEGNVYTIGGRNATANTNAVYCFPPNNFSSSFTPIATFDQILNDPSYCQDGKYIYFCNWVSTTTTVTNRFCRYDMSTNTFEELAPKAGMPGQVLVAHEGFIYCMGGTAGGNNITNAFTRYDIEQNLWETMPSMPGLIARGAAGVYDNKIYYHYGVWKSAILIGTSVVFDIATGIWSDVTYTNTRGAAYRPYAFVGKHCFYFGLARSSGNTGKLGINIFNEETKTITLIEDLLLPYFASNGAIFDEKSDRIYIVGGQVGGVLGTTTHVFKLGVL